MLISLVNHVQILRYHNAGALLPEIK